MENVYYSFIPVSIAVFIQLFFPYLKNIHCLDIWIVPHFYTCYLIFLSYYVLFGFTLWKSMEINNNKIFIITWILIVMNFVWVYTFKNNRKISLIALFSCLLLGYLNYNTIFLSSLVEEGDTMYLDFYSAYIISIGFTITILIETSPRKIMNEKKKRSTVNKSIKN